MGILDLWVVGPWHGVDWQVGLGQWHGVAVWAGTACQSTQQKSHVWRPWQRPNGEGGIGAQEGGEGALNLARLLGLL